MQKDLVVREHPHVALQALFILFVFTLIGSIVYVINSEHISLAHGLYATIAAIATVIAIYLGTPALWLRFGQLKRLSMTMKSSTFVKTLSSDEQTKKSIELATNGRASNIIIEGAHTVDGEFWLMKNIRLKSFGLRNMLYWLIGDIVLNMHGRRFVSVRTSSVKKINCILVTFDMEISEKGKIYSERFTVPLTYEGGFPVFFRKEKPIWSSGMDPAKTEPAEKVRQTVSA